MRENNAVINKVKKNKKNSELFGFPDTEQQYDNGNMPIESNTKRNVAPDSVPGREELNTTSKPMVKKTKYKVIPH